MNNSFRSGITSILQSYILRFSYVLRGDSLSIRAHFYHVDDSGAAERHMATQAVHSKADEMVLAVVIVAVVVVILVI